MNKIYADENQWFQILKERGPRAFNREIFDNSYYQEHGMIEMMDHDFRGLSLRRIYLELINCEGSNMSECDLRNANLNLTCLMNTHLVGANLTEASINSTVLAGANLKGAVLRRVSFVQGHKHSSANFNFYEERMGRIYGHPLYGNNVGCACFDEADFRGAEMDYADLREASFQGANFERAKLAECDFSGCNLEGVRFFRSELDAADFTGANLKNADFRYANVKDAVFTDADLQGVRGLQV